MRRRGFTLIEVLVALFILAIVAGLAWRGVDGMTRSRDVASERLEKLLRLQSVVAQWEADLAQLQDSGIVPALRFDGANLRLTRRTPEGLQLVVWSLRGESWTRWAAPPVTRSAALQEAWLRSQQLIGTEDGQLRLLGGVAGWQLYFWRGNAWSNAQSSADLAAAPPPADGASAPGAPPRELLPEGVRLVLNFAEASGHAGDLTRDLRLAPAAP